MYGVAEEGCEAGYVVHPAFNFGEEKLAGFWVGKYETSNTNCTTDVESGQVAYTGNETVTIKANVTSWRNINISNMFTTCINLNKEGNPYGLNTCDSVVDPHMMKNVEWGAVAYLSQNSKYGKGTEVEKNDNSIYVTADGDYRVNTNQSTTGNVWGIYDMSGGAYESVAAYVNNGDSYLNTYGTTLVAANTKYKDVYSVGSSDSKGDNYEVSTPNNGKYGEAVYETSNSSAQSNYDSWYSDRSYFPNSADNSYPFFTRGGDFAGAYQYGLFYFGGAGGFAKVGTAFRLILTAI